ncbi:hypothetical protein M378DRAFT_170057 [Amanita muscaria Koide BX008]|uniref:Uncharacterized protein n=1 Tax=Amanita muscaria (strain Koide BX008) TaxID=946122 RepID=A0A0C2S7W9_AMAMK|nr:hypothetical protein M378DRAFT_170057 [Amanita muscaria Koide BX008]
MVDVEQPVISCQKLSTKMETFIPKKLAFVDRLHPIRLFQNLDRKIYALPLSVSTCFDAECDAASRLTVCYDIRGKSLMSCSISAFYPKNPLHPTVMQPNVVSTRQAVPLSFLDDQHWGSWHFSTD